jgi:hypothetical protein
MNVSTSKSPANPLRRQQIRSMWFRTDKSKASLQRLAGGKSVASPARLQQICVIWFELNSASQRSKAEHRTVDTRQPFNFTHCISFCDFNFRSSRKTTYLGYFQDSLTTTATGLPSTLVSLNSMFYNSFMKPKNTVVNAIQMFLARNLLTDKL